MDDVLLHKNPFGEFECLIWERAKNKELSEELAKEKRINKDLIKSMRELKLIHETKLRDTLHMLRNKSAHGNLVAKNRALKDMNDAKDVKLKSLKRTNEDLMQGYIKLQREKRGFT